MMPNSLVPFDDDEWPEWKPPIEVRCWRAILIAGTISLVFVGGLVVLIVEVF